MASKATVINVDNYQELIGNGTPAILDFWATWCPHCKRIAPSYDKVAAEYEGKLIVGKVDTDEDPAIAQKYDIEYLPTFVGRGPRQQGCHRRIHPQPSGHLT